MKLAWIMCAVLAGAAGFWCGAKTARGADVAATQADDRTPLGVTRMEEREVQAGGGADKMRTHFHATTAEGKQAAELGATFDVAYLRLEKAAVGKFGKEDVAELQKALGWEGEDDLAKAQVKIEGEQADITFPGGAVWREIKVEGRWAFDSDRVAAAGNAEDLKKLLAYMKKMTEKMDALRGRVEKGEIARMGQLQSAAQIESAKVSAEVYPETQPGAGAATQGGN